MPKNATDFKPRHFFNPSLYQDQAKLADRRKKMRLNQVDSLLANIDEVIQEQINNPNKKIACRLIDEVPLILDDVNQRLALFNEEASEDAEPFQFTGPIYLKQSPSTLFDQPISINPNDRPGGKLMVYNSFVQEVVQRYQSGKGPIVTILANAREPGHKPFKSDAQEQSLCQTTDLLVQMPVKYPSANNEAIDKDLPAQSGLAQLGHSYRIEDVNLYEVNVDAGTAKPTHKMAAVFVAAPDLSQYKLQEYVSTEQGRMEYIRYIAMCVRMQCEHALAMNTDKLIAGALGCGVFSNNPYLVAAIYRAVLSERRYSRLNVSFAIKDYKKYNNLAKIFKEVFEAPATEAMQVLLTSKPFDPNQNSLLATDLSQKLVPLHEQVQKLKKQASELEEKGHAQDAKLANLLAGAIEDQLNELTTIVTDPDKTLKDCDDAIKKAMSTIRDYIHADIKKLGTKTNESINIYDTLSKHRGFKKIFYDILWWCTAILTLGIVPAILHFGKLNKPNRTLGFFDHRSNTQIQLDKLEKAAREFDTPDFNSIATDIEQNADKISKLVDDAIAQIPKLRKEVKKLRKQIDDAKNENAPRKAAKLEKELKLKSAVLRNEQFTAGCVDLVKGVRDSLHTIAQLCRDPNATVDEIRNGLHEFRIKLQCTEVSNSDGTKRKLPDEILSAFDRILNTPLGSKNPQTQLGAIEESLSTILYGSVVAESDAANIMAGLS